jgi:threonine aldolase
MRQAGVLAAAGIVALTTMVERLGDDHENAKVLARALAAVPGVILDNNAAATNMVYFYLDEDVLLDASDLRIALQAHGVLLDASDSRRCRVVTHYGLSKEMVERAAAVLVDVLKGAGGR